MCNTHHKLYTLLCVKMEHCCSKCLLNPISISSDPNSENQRQTNIIKDLKHNGHIEQDEQKTTTTDIGGAPIEKSTVTEYTHEDNGEATIATASTERTTSSDLEVFHDTSVRKRFPDLFCSDPVIFFYKTFVTSKSILNSFSPVP